MLNWIGLWISDADLPKWRSVIGTGIGRVGETVMGVDGIEDKLLMEMTNIFNREYETKPLFLV